MSDPVSNIEIEDVLSSIRRLVAEGDRLRPAAAAPGRPDQNPLRLEPSGAGDEATAPPPAPPPAQSADRSAAPSAARFVLTPSLRVDAAPSEPGVPAGAPDADADAEAEAGITDEAGTEAAPGGSAEPTAAAPPTVLLWDDEPQDGALDDLPEGLSGPLSHPDDARSAEADDAAGAETPQAARDDAPGSPDAAEAPGTAGTAPTTGTEKAAAATDTAETSTGHSRLESTIAELEAAINGQSQEFEPDGSEAEPEMDWVAGAARPTFLSSRTIHRPADVEDAEELTDRAAPASKDPGPTPHTDSAAGLDGALDETLTAYLEEEDILDEETLRAMVAEIVRQELQGALGERITRNVRKLVRREIYRVMSSQDLD